MKEELITLKTARIAKEKGFINEENMMLDDLNNTHFIEIPTQSLLQKWLREVHKLWINCFYTKSGKYCYIIHNINDDGLDHSDYIFNSYENALEEGLFESLKLINYE